VPPAGGRYEWLLFAHILAAMVWVGGAVLLGVLAIRVVRDGERGAVGRFVAGMRVIGPRVLAPATIAVVGFGVWLVLDSRWRRPRAPRSPSSPTTSGGT